MSQDRTWILLGRKISGEATLDELRELETLLKEDAQLSYQASLIKELELSTPDITGETETALEKHMQRMQELYPEDFKVTAAPQATLPESRSWLRKNGIRVLAVAASLMVVILGGWWSLRDRKEPDNKELVSEISTRHGSRTMVTLPDGSVVFLNVSSKLTYDYGNDDSRQVVLEGEAFFDVFKDEQRPFIIHTKKMDITVLGTTFNVRAYEEDKTVETSLIQGKVEVTIKGEVPKKVILSPNQKIVLFNEEQQPRVVSVPTPGNPDKESYRLEEVTVNPLDSLVAETAWKENCLVFNNERFADIALKMERWYDVQIIFEDKQVEDYRFTGTFINETVDQTLEALRFTSPFHYRIDKKRIIIKR
ncbi:FecR family protein [Chitinophaga sp. CF418]|uniref:FecR family protein n=1 Tax=Chitinophaga sp. CF418 TaxID=1855287 RepID=UPI00091A076B|nr:FecR domain-containing protein [Chitinophaga sp. CF418]SHL93291.1 FecR family protein [Chitinophaga sp. CF418]